MILKTRLSLSVAALVTTVLVAVLTVVSIRESRALLEQARQQRRTNVRELARLCETTLGLGQEKILLNFLGLWTASNSVVDVGLWDRDGVLQTHSDFLKGDFSGVRRTYPALARTAMAGGPREIPGSAGGRPTLDMTWPVFEGGRPYGFLRARFDRARLDAERRALVFQTIRQLLWVGAAAEALGLLVGLIMAWSLTVPIGILSESARAIGDGTFPESIPVRRNDELGGLARELERMAGQLKRASEFKDSFLRRVSHNMRSPLASIESALYHARNAQADAPTEVMEDYEIIRQGAGELTIFINNLLDLERIRRGKMVYRYERCSCDEMIEAVVHLHSRLAQDKELELS
ncbi:MAG TPA: HAMP domain-containing protein, partial [Elusimicrobiota bacterium]|nr:HAMP domain-containing protein [Elusimicrobiota bacterium]